MDEWTKLATTTTLIDVTREPAPGLGAKPVGAKLRAAERENVETNKRRVEECLALLRPYLGP